MVGSFTIFFAKNREKDLQSIYNCATMILSISVIRRGSGPEWSRGTPDIKC